MERYCAEGVTARARYPAPTVGLPPSYRFAVNGLLLRYIAGGGERCYEIESGRFSRVFVDFNGQYVRSGHYVRCAIFFTVSSGTDGDDVMKSIAMRAVEMNCREFTRHTHAPPLIPEGTIPELRGYCIQRPKRKEPRQVHRRSAEAQGWLGWVGVLGHPPSFSLACSP